MPRPDVLVRPVVARSSREAASIDESRQDFRSFSTSFANKSFATTTSALLEVTTWLEEHQCTRLRARRGAKKAIIAVAASMLTAAYYILRDKVPYKDLGPNHFTRRDKKHVVRRLRRIEDLGFAVEIRSTTACVSI
jgi:transposase